MSYEPGTTISFTKAVQPNTGGRLYDIGTHIKFIWPMYDDSGIQKIVVA